MASRTFGRFTPEQNKNKSGRCVFKILKRCGPPDGKPEKFIFLNKIALLSKKGGD
jgi:hypothetical protein